MVKRWLLCCFVMFLTAIASAQAPTTPGTLKVYTPEEVSQISVDDFFAFLRQPEPGYQHNAARLALRAKADADAATRQYILEYATDLATDVRAAITERTHAFYLLAELHDLEAVPMLADALFDERNPMLRSAAAWALGQMRSAEAEDALREALEYEEDEQVLGWIRRALERAAAPQQVTEQQQVRFWLVKDWHRLRNSGPRATNVEFRRYFPVIDDEQIAAVLRQHRFRPLENASALVSALEGECVVKEGAKRAIGFL